MRGLHRPRRGVLVTLEGLSTGAADVCRGGSDIDAPDPGCETTTDVA